MIVTFEEKYLRDLYTDGKTSDRKYRFQPDIIRRYQKGVRALISASTKESLYTINSLRFEALGGNFQGKYSIRVNDKYRIIFTLRETPDEPIITICNITELSKHYD